MLDDHLGAHAVPQQCPAPSGDGALGIGLRSRSLSGHIRGPAGAMLRTLLLAMPGVGE